VGCKTRKTQQMNSGAMPGSINLTRRRTLPEAAAPIRRFALGVRLF